MNPLIDPRLLQVLEARLSERATLKSEVEARSPTGQKRSLGRQPIAGLENLPCEVVPITNRKGGEIDAGTGNASSTVVVSSHQIAFAGVPAIDESMTLQVLGTGINAGIYDIDRLLPDGVGLHLIVEATKVSL